MNADRTLATRSLARRTLDSLSLLGAPLRQRAIWRVAMLAAVTIVLTAWVAILSMRETTRTDWKDQMASLSLILAEQASQTIFSAHTVLNLLSDRVAQEHLADEQSYRKFAGSETQHRLLVDATRANPIIDVATFLADDGQVLNFTRSFPVPPINLADRDYFKAHQADPGIDIFTSAPVRNKGTGTWVFYLSRRVNDSSGRMLGLVLVGVSVEAFSEFYRKVVSNLGEGASISLYRSDFTLMTRWPFVDDQVGKQVQRGTTREALADPRVSSGVFMTTEPRATDAGKSDARMAAPRRLARYPFIVTPVISQDLYQRNWIASSRWILFSAAISLALGAQGTVRWLAASRRVSHELEERVLTQAQLKAAHEKLEARVVERTAELRREVGERELAQRELARVNARIAGISHRAGMAEVANSVLHNVGNVLNSVNVSVSVLSEQLRQTPLVDLPEVAALTRCHRTDLARFLNDDPRGRQVGPFIEMLAEQWQAEHAVMLAETAQLALQVSHISDIVSRQQSVSGQSGTTEAFMPADTLRDALAIHHTVLALNDVQVDTGRVMPDRWLGDRGKLTQIVVNLIVNAEEAVCASTNCPRSLALACDVDALGTLTMSVTDNGVGMAAETLDKLFTYGFTTKPSGHGFGLHASALAAEEMGGRLQASSAGVGQGSCFTLTLPRKDTLSS